MALDAVNEFPKAVAISALEGTGFDELMRLIEAELFENYTKISVQIPYAEGQLISLFHEQGQVEYIEHTRKGVFIQGMIPGRLLARYNGFQATAPTDKLTDDDLLTDPDETQE